jgi:Fur family transcriptional regulator, iron response regulator
LIADTLSLNGSPKYGVQDETSISGRIWSRITFWDRNACASALLQDDEPDKKKVARDWARPTRTRVALGNILFAKGNRHISAEMLFEEANQAKVSVSLATVYNTLNQFTEAGLLRQVAINSSKSYFDTNNAEHHHYYLEDSHELMDIPSADVAVGEIPGPPAGYEIVRVDVVVRLRRKEPARRWLPLSGALGQYGYEYFGAHTLVP